MLLRIFLSILLIQCVFFVLAAWRRTDLFTDISYGGTFVLIAVRLFFQKSDFTALQWLITFCIVLWWVRLAWYLFLRILYIKTDKRFDGMRDNRKHFGKFRLLQAVSIFVIWLASNVLLLDAWPHPFHVWIVIGFVIFAYGRYLETKADRQKFHFKKQYPDRFVNVWLRARARHPNYFGEILVWWWIFLMCVTQFSWRQVVTIVSPLFITRLLLAVSGIPPLEAQHDKKYGDDPDYQQRKNETNLLVPF